MSAKSAPTVAPGSSVHDDTARRAADPSSTTKDLLTVDEARALLDMTRAAFYAYRRRNRIPNAIHGRAIRIRRADLLRVESAGLATRLVDYAELGRQHARGELRRA